MHSFSRALLVAMALAGPALAADIRPQDLDKLWGRYAVGFGEKPKMGCVCFDGANDYRLGHLIRATSDSAACYFTSFTPDGAFSGASPCTGPFAPLAR
jgi:hypothetical protein